MKLGISGRRSSITTSFLLLSNKYEEIVTGSIHSAPLLPLDCDHYLLCTGVLYGSSATDITPKEAASTFHTNFLVIAKFLDTLFDTNKNAKVCVIGSESGFNGSYDMAYAGSKAALHLYVETKKLLYKDQHLVCIAPTIIEDSGMTQRRADLNETIRRGKDRRMGRWLNAAEVARTAKFAINEPSLSNTIIRITGGNW